MKLSLATLNQTEAWKQVGVTVPEYDVAAVAEKTRKSPKWVHLGIGNIFRIFIGGIADTLLAAGEMDHGITCVETFDYDVVDKIYKPYDNLLIGVTLHNDGSTDRRIIGSLSEAVKAVEGDESSLSRLKAIFTDPGLQLVSMTITEKGYALRSASGKYFPFVERDLNEGPGHFNSAMSFLAYMLLERFKAGKAPLAIVSMDNISQNGSTLRAAVLEVIGVWYEKGFVDKEFVDYVKDESKIAFPWTMIDKITPRPADAVADALEADGIEDMKPIVTSRNTYIAPFVNAEGPQYLVIEDSFPNGRPPFEKAGVYVADRDTVNKSERMKVTALLNPIHTALGPYGSLLGYEYFADSFANPLLLKLAKILGYDEGMKFVPDPGILSPKAFLDELIEERFPNTYLGDTTQRLVFDSSQMIGVRFGDTTRAFVKAYGTAASLTGVPLAIAGWIRYHLAVDDQGEPMVLAADPLNDEITELLSGIEYGKPETVGDKLLPLLKNEIVFHVDFCQAGLGDKITEIFSGMITGPGSVKATLEKYLA